MHSYISIVFCFFDIEQVVQLFGDRVLSPEGELHNTKEQVFNVSSLPTDDN